MSAHDTCLWYPATDHTWRSCVGRIYSKWTTCPDCGRPVEFHKPQDQAQGLRELVKDLSAPCIFRTTNNADGLFKLVSTVLDEDKDEMVEKMQDMANKFLANYERSAHDHAALWAQLKSELEAEADSHYQDSANKWHGDALKAAAARAMLDRMLQMETLAVGRRVAVPSTMEPT